MQLFSMLLLLYAAVLATVQGQILAPGQDPGSKQIPNPWIEGVESPFPIDAVFPLVPDLQNFDARWFVIIPATFRYFPDLTPTLRFADPTSVIWVRALRLAAVYGALSFHSCFVLGFFSRCMLTCLSLIHI